MLPTFGCGVHDLLFDSNNPSTRTEAVDAVRSALVAWEARIDVLDVTAEFSPAQPSLLLIRIGYRIRANNAVTNLVYPFYINESV
jgi:phage baseplate assembly protein W